MANYFSLGVGLWFLASEALFANAFNFERDGSRLKLQWQSGSAGTWTLKTKDGLSCADGLVQVGPNAVSFPKIVSADDLRLTLNGQNYEIAGSIALSNLTKPTSTAVIYQMEVRTFLARERGEAHAGKLAELTSERLRAIKNLGVDYLWLTGVLEHANRKNTDPDVVKGDAGSYYAVHDHWDVSSQIGDLEEFDRFIKRAHAVGLRVLIDFVANHTARVHSTDVTCKQSINLGQHDQTERSFSPFNNYYYLDPNSIFVPPIQMNTPQADGVFDRNIHLDDVQFEQPAKVTGNDRVTPRPNFNDWFETVKLNYGYDLFTKRSYYVPVPPTWEQMLDIAQYWVEKGVDGFRVDFAHAVPIEFWKFFARRLRSIQTNIFLLAEAYEGDSMSLPGFSYEAVLAAGFDSVYNAKMYWDLRRQASLGSDMFNVNYFSTAGGRAAVLERGFKLTNYMENHDEIRLAHQLFSPALKGREQRARAGYNYSAYSALLPGNFLLHGGQELEEDASVFGSFEGDKGRTSMFDFVFQNTTRTWLFESSLPEWMINFRQQYMDLLKLKGQSPFNLAHSLIRPTFIELNAINRAKQQSSWVGSYLRFDDSKSYLVIFNSDPVHSHNVVLHFVNDDGQDQLGALAAMGIRNDDTRYGFTEVLTHKGMELHDPNVSGRGLPGWVLYRPRAIPSGLYVGDLEPASSYVFRIDRF